MTEELAQEMDTGSIEGASTEQEQASVQEVDTSKPIPVKHHPSVEVVKANFNNLVDFKPITISFKTDKLGFKRPSFNFDMPVPSVEGAVEIFNKGGPELNLLMEAVESIVYAQARAQINDLIEAGGNIDGSSIDVSKLLWSNIAKLSKLDKRSSTIPKEIWDAFAADYIKVITNITKIDEEKAVLASKLLVNKFQKAKGKPRTVNFLLGQLDIWFANTAQDGEFIEEFAEIYSLLTAKGNEALKEDEESLLENLGA